MALLQCQNSNAFIAWKNSSYGFQIWVLPVTSKFASARSIGGKGNFTAVLKFKYKLLQYSHRNSSEITCYGVAVACSLKELGKSNVFSSWRCLNSLTSANPEIGKESWKLKIFSERIRKILRKTDRIEFVSLRCTPCSCRCVGGDSTFINCILIMCIVLSRQWSDVVVCDVRSCLKRLSITLSKMQKEQKYLNFRSMRFSPMGWGSEADWWHEISFGKFGFDVRLMWVVIFFFFFYPALSLGMCFYSTILRLILLSGVLEYHFRIEQELESSHWQTHRICYWSFFDCGKTLIFLVNAFLSA